MAKGKRQRGNGQGSLFRRSKTGPWYISWYTADGKRPSESTGTTDKATAQRILNQRVAEVALRRGGVIDATMDTIAKQAARPIEEHLDDYRATMQTAGRKAKTISDNIGFIQWVTEHNGWQTAGEITADGVNRYGRSLAEAGRSAQTIRNHLSAVKAFTKWLSTHAKLPRDPLMSVKRPSAKADRRRERRMLLPDEWQWLRSATEKAERYGMPGAERMLLYTTAIQTGLRASELASLRRGQLFLDAEHPYITVKAKATKNAKDARQYIQAGLAEQLREHVATKTPNAAVFTLPDRHDLAKMIRADLADARQAWLDAVPHDPEERDRRLQSDFLAEANHEGATLDFHSLRHTCGAWLALSGAHPKAIQAVMRHSTITLTMDTYGHLVPGQEAETVARFPSMLPDETEAAQATGTYDVVSASESYSSTYSSRIAKSSERVRPCANGSAAGDEDHAKASARKAAPIAGIGDGVRCNTTGIGEGGIRTHGTGKPAQRFSRPPPSATRPPLHVGSGGTRPAVRVPPNAVCR